MVFNKVTVTETNLDDSAFEKPAAAAEYVK
jgi:hypothetical protein